MHSIYSYTIVKYFLYERTGVGVLRIDRGSILAMTNMHDHYELLKTVLIYYMYYLPLCSIPRSELLTILRCSILIYSWQWEVHNSTDLHLGISNELEYV